MENVAGEFVVGGASGGLQARHLGGAKNFLTVRIATKGEELHYI
jgi:hypothetical protein